MIFFYNNVAKKKTVNRQGVGVGVPGGVRLFEKKLRYLPYPMYKWGSVLTTPINASYRHPLLKIINDMTYHHFGHIERPICLCRSADNNSDNFAQP